MTVTVDGRHPTKILLDPFLAFDALLVAEGLRIERLQRADFFLDAGQVAVLKG
jgi:hypothetical protein